MDIDFQPLDQDQTSSQSSQIDFQPLNTDSVSAPLNHATSDELERSSKYPTAAMTDVSVPDALAIEGAAGLGKTAAGLGARGVGAGLNAISPNIVPSVGDMSDDMLLKSMGARAGGIKAAGGIEAARDAADVARQAGVGDVLSTERGRVQSLKDLITNQGKEIGDLRNQAGNASPDVLEQVKNNLQAKYGGNGLYSSEAGQIPQALNDVKRIGGETPLSYPTNAGLSKGATFLNDYATGNKLTQPVNAVTDIANQLSAANNADIAQKLGPDKALQYLQALKNESGAMHLQPVLNSGMAREAVSRGGGKGILQSLIQKAADTGGYRAASKGLNAIHGALSTTPDLSSVGPNALKAYLAQKAEEDNQ